jgi:hypothetical protein
MIVVDNIITQIKVGSEWETIAHATDGVLNVQTESFDVVNDVTILQSKETGMLSWNLTTNNLVSYDADFGLSELITEVMKKSRLLIKFTSGISQQYEFEGYAYIENINISMAIGDNLKFSVAFAGDSGLDLNLIGDPE